jgi:hypothetical protein
MRIGWAAAVLGSALAVGSGAKADADRTPVTGGTLQFYVGDPGSAELIGVGFDVTSMAAGAWPVSVRPGDLVDFSTDVTLSSWGSALIDGIRLHGDTSGSGAGRLWITGTIHVAAVPFRAPPLSEFAGSLQTPVSLFGAVAGYASTDLSRPPVFAVNIVGSGTAEGTYRLIERAGDSFYLDACCARVTVAASPTPASLMGRPPERHQFAQ